MTLQFRGYVPLIYGLEKRNPNNFFLREKKNTTKMPRSHTCSYSTDVLQIKDLVKTNEIKNKNKQKCLQR